MFFRVSRLLLPVLAVAGCAAPTSEPIVPLEVPVAPSRAAVKALVDAKYTRPSLHVLAQTPELLERGGAQVQIWRRTYDGVDMLVDVRTSTMGSEWKTRAPKELAEPEPVRRADVISEARAAASAGLDEGVATKRLTTRLVHHPQFVQVARVPEVKNAEDVELSIAHYRLAWELSDPVSATKVYVDAYSGEEIERVPLALSVVKTVQTMNYGTVALDVSEGPYDSRTNTQSYVLKDPIRTSLFDSSNKPINGQGLVTGTPTSTLIPLTYERVSQSRSFNNDLVFGVRQSWDYFREMHGRRGLRNRVRASIANDAIVYFNPGAAQSNLFMDSSTGLIRVDQGPAWEEWTTVDVAGHEWSHAVFAHDAPDLPTYYWGSSGGINEANSDLFGEAVEAYTVWKLGQQPSDEVTDRWQFGQNVMPWGIRSMCTPVVSEWSAAMDDPVAKMEAHDASGPFSRVFCLLANGMVPYGQAGHPELQSPIVPNGFLPLGIRAVTKLQYQALTLLAMSSGAVTAMQVRQSLLDAATLLHGLHSPEYKAIEDTFAVVKIGQKANRAFPSVSLISGDWLTQNMAIAASVQSTNTMQDLTFKLNDEVLGVVTAPGPWLLVPPAKPEGAYTLSLVPRDVFNNSSVSQYQVTFDGSGPQLGLTDVTPCSPTVVCPDYQYKRLYRITATDFSKPIGLSLTVDGAAVAIPAGEAPFDMPVQFFVGGQRQLQLTGVDAKGNTSTLPKIVDVDLDPPVITTPVTLEADAVVEGWQKWHFCAADASGVLPARITLDGVLLANMGWVANTGPGCWWVAVSLLSVGSHTYTLHIFDRWNNKVELSGTFMQPARPPIVQVPSVVADSLAGKATITTSYSHVKGVAKVTTRVCANGSCTSPQVFTPASSGPDQTGHVFNFTGLSAGTKTAEVVVQANNGLTTTKYSAPFVLTTPLPAPVLTTPASNSVVPPCHQICWKQVPGGNFYEWRYSRNGVVGGSLTGPPSEWTAGPNGTLCGHWYTVGPNNTPTCGPQPCANLKYEVRVKNDVAAWSNWSAPRSGIYTQGCQ